MPLADGRKVCLGSMQRSTSVFLLLFIQNIVILGYNETGCSHSDWFSFQELFVHPVTISQ